jgi:uncharacterized protein (DUF2141 family)
LQKAFLLGAMALFAACPASAQAEHSRITCETVRAFVAEVGLVQARVFARAHGMTASQERRARHCLAESGAAEPWLLRGSAFAP